MQSGVLSLKAQRSKEHAFRYFQLKPASRGFCLHVCVHWHKCVCAFTYKTFPTSVQGSNLFKN